MADHWARLRSLQLVQMYATARTCLVTAPSSNTVVIFVDLASGNCVDKGASRSGWRNGGCPGCSRQSDYIYISPLLMKDRVQRLQRAVLVWFSEWSRALVVVAAFLPSTGCRATAFSPASATTLPCVSFLSWCCLLFFLFGVLSDILYAA